MRELEEKRCPWQPRTLEASRATPGLSSRPRVQAKLKLGVATARIQGLRGGGAPLSAGERAYFEPRFGRSFDAVRIHTGPEATSTSQAIQAKAFAYGSDIAFGQGQFAPGTVEGRRLLAHELTHVVQQGAAPRVDGAGGSSVQRKTTPMVQGDWIINSHSRRATAGGPTDGQLVEDAFRDICPMTTRTNDRITMVSGPPPPNRMEGCGCLQDIEADLASSSPVLNGTPHIGLTVDGWSSTSPTASPPIVNARHPQGSFEWGYWTGGQKRELKPFFRTVAHEICGHVVTLVRTGGAHAGGRRSPTGHNEAIKGENRVAGEHGVPASRQRGLDLDPATGNPLSGHRGESFLQADVAGFAHGNSGTVSTNVALVVTGAVNTIATVQTNNGVSLMVQVEGFALSNEGRSVAHQRAAAVHAVLDTAIRAKSGLTVPAAGRFQPDLDTVLSGHSAPGTSNGGRRVQVYLFHKLHSVGP